MRLLSVMRVCLPAESDSHHPAGIHRRASERRSDAWSRFVFSPRSRTAWLTMMSGRKLDIVCSTQPYGNDVKYSSAPKTGPASDGATLIVNRRDPGGRGGGAWCGDVGPVTPKR